MCVFCLLSMPLPPRSSILFWPIYHTIYSQSRLLKNVLDKVSLLPGFWREGLNSFKMAAITDQELEAEFDQFGVELGDLMVIEKCKLFYLSTS